MTQGLKDSKYRPAIDLTGQRFGRLLVLSPSVYQGKWEARCDCGNCTVVIAQNLKTGTTKSCGCLKKENKHSFRHGLSKKAGVYKSWLGMKERCLNTKHHAHHLYGGRGITICERWMSFENFLQDMGHSSKGQSIDRINNNGNYEPNNCRWATQSEQNNNYRRNKLLTYNDETKNMNQWSISKGWNPRTVQNRIKNGWSIERALTQPVNERRTL